MFSWFCQSSVIFNGTIRVAGMSVSSYYKNVAGTFYRRCFQADGTKQDGLSLCRKMRGSYSRRFQAAIWGQGRPQKSECARTAHRGRLRQKPYNIPAGLEPPFDGTGWNSMFCAVCRPEPCSKCSDNIFYTSYSNKKLFCKKTSKQTTLFLTP